MADYSGIIERLEKAEGPSMPLDCMVLEAVCPDVMIDSYPTAADDACVFHADAAGIDNKSPLPQFTASIDAAVALTERMLPGWIWNIEGSWTDGNGKKVPSCADIYRLNASDMDHVPYSGATPPIALLIAMFRALQARPE